MLRVVKDNLNPFRLMVEIRAPPHNKKTKLRFSPAYHVRLSNSSSHFSTPEYSSQSTPGPDCPTATYGLQWTMLKLQTRSTLPSAASHPTLHTSEIAQRVSVQSVLVAAFVSIDFAQSELSLWSATDAETHGPVHCQQPCLCRIFRVHGGTVVPLLITNQGRHDSTASGNRMWQYV